MFRRTLRQHYFAKRTLFDKVLIANRGEIACRVIRSCKKLGVRSVAVYSDIDAESRHVQMADEAIWIGPAPSKLSYLNIDAICQAVQQSRAQAVHPGYGFLSENYKFAESLAKLNVEFIGPPVNAIKSMGSKSESKKIMIGSNVPVIPGYNEDEQDPKHLLAQADKIGYPLLIKAVLGGGGKGMRVVESKDEFMDKLDSAKNEALNSFKDDRVILERFITNPRHIEVQVFADKHGNTVYLFERDCSSQRRHQKIIEEAPAPLLTEEMRRQIGETAVRAAKAVGYVGAGTVEFILDQDTSQFYFLEMNTRLQVEHPITEMITGVDLAASNERLPVQQSDLKINGHAMEVRVYAEDPTKGFAPDSGLVTDMTYPQESPSFRFETGIRPGDEVSTFYDPMIAKVVVHGPDRHTAISRLQETLANLNIVGVSTNTAFVRSLLRSEKFLSGTMNANYVDQNYKQFLPKVAPLEQVCALVAAKMSLDSRGDSNWSAVGGMLMSMSTVTIDDENVSVRLRDNQLLVNDKIHDFKVISDNHNTIAVQVGNQLVRGSVTSPSRDAYMVFIDGVKYAVYKAEPAKRTTTGQPSKELAIKSHMPSRILSVSVKPGDRVAVGTKLLVTEAMKMEHVVKSQVEGVVERVHCRPGQTVPSGALLVELRQSDGC